MILKNFTTYSRQNAIRQIPEMNYLQDQIKVMKDEDENKKN